MKKFLIATAAVGMFTTAAYADTIRVRVPVVDSQPNIVTKTVQKPYQSCSTVDVPIYGRSGNGASAGDVLGGMIIGGLLGKGVTGKDNGAAAGAVIGGLVAADNKQGNQQIIGYRQEQRCKTSYQNEQIDQINGYTLTYVLDGKEYTTISTRHVEPGRELTLRLAVTSVFTN